MIEAQNGFAPTLVTQVYVPVSPASSHVRSKVAPSPTPVVVNGATGFSGGMLGVGTKPASPIEAPVMPPVPFTVSTRMVMPLASAMVSCTS